MNALPLIAIAGLLSACSGLQRPTASLDGEVFYLQRSALPPSAVLRVSLQDVSGADAPARILVQQSMPVSSQPPLPFHIEYDPSEVRVGNSYAISARIEADGRLLFISTERHAVLLDGSDAQPLRIRVNPAHP